MNTQNNKIEQTYRTHLILWLAFLMSQVVFLFVVFAARPELLKFDFSKPLLDDNMVLIIALAFFAVLNVGLSFIFRAQYVKMAIDEQSFALLQQGMILGIAFCESAAIFGLVLAFIDNYQYFFAWNLLAIVGTLLHFPRRQNLFDASDKK